jgi:hypothetical protein
VAWRSWPRDDDGNEIPENMSAAVCEVLETDPGLEQPVHVEFAAELYCDTMGIRFGGRSVVAKVECLPVFNADRVTADVGGARTRAAAR